MQSYCCLSCGNLSKTMQACCSHPKIVLLCGQERVKTLGEVMNMQLRGVEIKGFETLGRLPQGFKMLIYGKPGSLKSSLALLLCNKFHAKSLYCSIEEGISESFLNKLQYLQITNPKISFSNPGSIAEIEEDLASKPFSLVVVDSLSVLQSIPKLDDRVSQVFVCHSRKDGIYKGDSKVGHLVDIILKCEDGGMAVAEKNRFGSTGERFGILEERYAKEKSWF